MLFVVEVEEAAAEDVGVEPVVVGLVAAVATLGVLVCFEEIFPLGISFCLSFVGETTLDGSTCVGDRFFGITLILSCSSVTLLLETGSGLVLLLLFVELLSLLFVGVDVELSSSILCLGLGGRICTKSTGNQPTFIGERIGGDN